MKGKKTVGLRAMVAIGIMSFILLGASWMPFLTVEAAGKTYITSSAMAKSVFMTDGMWFAKNETNTFDAECNKAYWVGSAKVGFFDSTYARSLAEFCGPDGSKYSISFDFSQKNSAYVWLELGSNSWRRKPAGQWELRISREGYEPTVIPFVVEPAKDPDSYKTLYEQMKPLYEEFLASTVPFIAGQDSYLDNVELAEFRGGLYVHVSLRYKWAYNDHVTNPYSRASDLLQEVMIKTLKGTHQAFGLRPEIQGYIIDMTLSHYDFRYPHGAVPKSETIKLVITMADMAKYANLETTMQDLVNSSIVLINDERIQLNLQPGK